MRYAFALAFLAGPALAHDGIHAHPHGSEGWVVGVALLVIAAAAATAIRARR